jgi:hypothetical protein
LEEVRRRVPAIGGTLQEVLPEARRASITPLDAAMRLVARRLEVGTSKSRYRTHRAAPTPARLRRRREG